MEKHFGTLSKGMSFGESFMLGGNYLNRFFNAISLTDCILLTLKKEKYDEAMGAAERRIYQDKKDFLKSLPEFKNYSLSTVKSKQLGGQFFPMSCIKGSVIFKEGEPNNRVYFVREGQFLVTKKVLMPKLDEEMEDTQKIFEDPAYIREK